MSPFPFLYQLLAKAVARRTAGMPIEEHRDLVNVEYARASYIRRVLQAPDFVRTSVRNRCIASNSLGQKHLAAILTMFETMSAEKKADFIYQWVAINALSVQGPAYVALQDVWPPGQPPFGDPP